MSRCCVCLEKLEQKTLKNGHVVITDPGYHKVNKTCADRGKESDPEVEDLPKELYVCKRCWK